MTETTDDPTELKRPIAACPECLSSNIHERQTKTPAYRCGDCGDEFAEFVYKNARYKNRRRSDLRFEDIEVYR